MGLTESKKKDLHDKKLDDLYAKHETEWQKMADDAYTFTEKHISKGSAPLRDDVLKTLLPMLEVSEKLRTHQEEKRCRFKRYREYFGEYIVEKKFHPDKKQEAKA